MVRRILVLFVLGVIGVFVAQPAAYAQYHAQGPFTVNPSNIVQGGTAQVQGYCEIPDTVTVKLDGTTLVGQGTVPGTNDHDNNYLVTGSITITITIPVSTTTGPHTLVVDCTGGTAPYHQVLNITVLAPVCATGSTQPPPLGGVYGNYGGDPQGGSPAPRSPSPNASFAGTLTSATTGMPIPNASVSLLRSDGTSVGTQTNTDSTGYYAFGTISKGQSYKVRFVELGFQTLTSSPLQLYTGTPIVVNGSMQVAPNGPGVSGTVTDVVTHQLLANVSVRLWLANSIGRYLATSTDVHGQYSFVGIPAGDYQVQFATSGYATYWHLNATSRPAATVITVGASQLTVDAQMTGLCKGNPTLVSAIFGGKALPFTLTTGGTLIMVAGSAALLIDSKRKVARSRAGAGRGRSGSSGSGSKRRLLARIRR